MSREEIKDLTKTALSSGNHMIDLLNDILNKSKNKYLANQPVKHTIPCRDLANEVFAPFKVLSRSLEIDFSSEYIVRNEDDNLVVNCDRTKCKLLLVQ